MKYGLWRLLCPATLNMKSPVSEGCQRLRPLRKYNGGRLREAILRDEARRGHDLEAAARKQATRPTVHLITTLMEKFRRIPALSQRYFINQEKSRIEMIKVIIGGDQL